MRRLIPIAALALLVRGAAAAEDCNGNGTPDAEDVASGGSEDCDRNGRPDECDPPGADFDLVMEARAELGRIAAIAAADLDGDARPDVAAAPRDSREIAVLINEDGTFPLTSYFDVSAQPTSILLADLDGDGDLDAAAGHSGGVAVLWNDGTGALGAETLLGISQNPSTVHVSDLNGDGRLDILTLNDPDAGPTNISVLLNGDAGRFDAPRQYAAGSLCRALALIDLDRDGDLDGAIADAHDPAGPIGSVPQLRRLENAGDGSFPRSPIILRLGFPTESMTAGHLDGDGLVDLLLANTWGVAPLLGNGDGAFTELPSTGAPEVAFGAGGAVAGDLDADGVLDAILLGTGTVLLNDGSGALAARRMSPGLVGSAGATADLDGNGDLDVLVAGWNWVSFHFHRPAVPIADCNGNGVRDACEEDCDRNGVPDDCDLASGAAEDCNGNTLPDACEVDCDRDGIPDDCEVAAGSAPDCNGNLVPDPCEPPELDGDGNGVPDDCDIASGAAADCNANGLPDERETEPSYGFRGMASSPLQAWVIAPVDLDGDGSTDILARDHERVLLFRDPGRLGFLSGTVVGSGSGPVAAADLDGDGDTDICMARGWYGYGTRTELAVLLRSADRLEKKGSIVLPFRPSSVVAGLFDGDSLPDLCLSGEGAVWLLKGLGSGLLGPPELVFRASGALTACDLDADGSAELIVHGDAARVLANDREGRFTETVNLPAGGGGIVAGDLDGDGSPDLATGGGYVYRGDGNGFSTLVKLGDRTRRYDEERQSVAAGDFDGDGNLDILLADQGGLWTYRNEGAGSFRVLPLVSLPGSGQGSIHSADIDGNGLGDLIVEGIWMLLNLGGSEPPAFGRRVLSHADNVSDGIAAIDLEGDGDRDLAVLKVVGGLALHPNLGDGSFGEATFVAAEGAQTMSSAADLDGDGDEDLAVGSHTAPRVTLLWNDGWLSLRAGATLEGGGAQVSSIAVADFDGRGGPDLATAAGQGTDVSIFLHEEGEAFRAAPQVPFGEPQYLVLALDAEGDGDIDLAAVPGRFGFQAGSSLTFLLNDGRASFERGGTFQLGGPASAGIAADLNGDDLSDLAITLADGGSCGIFDCDSSTTTVLFLSGGNGRFREVRRESGSFVSSGIAAADFDLDGDLDLALPQTWRLDFALILSGSSVRVLMNDGDGDFSRVISLPSGSAGDMAAADFDGDGHPDLAAVSIRSVSIAYSRLAAPSPDMDRDGVPDECAGARFRRGDADADGAVSVADAIVLLGRLFLGEAAGTCGKAEDWNDDGTVDLSDPLGILGHLFLGGPAPPPPHARCGVDASLDLLGCDAHAPCA